MTGVEIPDFIKECTSKELIIPPNITTIKAGWFINSEVSAIKIGSTVKYIERDSLDGIESIYIDSLADWCNITFDENYEPLFCKNLFVKGVCVIGLAIPEGVEHIPAWAFSYCNNMINEIVIPDSVTTVGEGAFLSIGATVNSITYAHNWVVSVNEVRATDIVLAKDTVGIADGAFFASSAERLIIPKSVKYIGNKVFEHCRFRVVIAPSDIRQELMQQLHGQYQKLVVA